MCLCGGLCDVAPIGPCAGPTETMKQLRTRTVPAMSPAMHKDESECYHSYTHLLSWVSGSFCSLSTRFATNTIYRSICYTPPGCIGQRILQPYQRIMPPVTGQLRSTCLHCCEIDLRPLDCGLWRSACRATTVKRESARCCIGFDPSTGGTVVEGN